MSSWIELTSLPPANARIFTAYAEPAAIATTAAVSATAVFVAATAVVAALVGAIEVTTLYNSKQDGVNNTSATYTSAPPATLVPSTTKPRSRDRAPQPNPTWNDRGRDISFGEFDTPATSPETANRIWDDRLNGGRGGWWTPDLGFDHIKSGVSGRPTGRRGDGIYRVHRERK